MPSLNCIENDSQSQEGVGSSRRRQTAAQALLGWPVSRPCLIMVAVARLIPGTLVLALLIVSVGAASAEKGATSARAFAVQVAVPGQSGGSAASVSAPPDGVGVGGSFSYPADGSVVRAGSVTSGAFATPGS